MHRILVVDDDADLLFNVERILKKKQLLVVALSDCTTAVEAALHHNPDLILLDVNMGACDGRDICKQLKLEKLITIPILLFSANGEYASSIEEHKADGFIQKPFSSSEFTDLIFKHLPA